MATVQFSSSDQPIVITEDGSLYRSASEYLLYKRQIEAQEVTTVVNLAYLLANWISYLESLERNVLSVTTLTIVSYRDRLKLEGEINKSTINRKISGICAFYYWVQIYLGVENLIGWNDIQRPSNRYAIVVSKPATQNRAPYSIPFLLPEFKPDKRPVPTAKQIDKVFELIENRSIASRKIKLHDQIITRNVLMLRWMCEAGLRRNEVVNLRVSDLPSDFGEGLNSVVISHGTKSGKHRRIKVEKSLLQDTSDFIEYERGDLVSEYLDSNPLVVFVKTTGDGQLAAETLTEMFDGSEIDPHGMRRYHLTLYARMLYQVERKLVSESTERRQIDLKAIELDLCAQAGHEKFSTTHKYYLDVAMATALNEVESECLKHAEREARLKLAIIQDRLASAQA